MPSLEVDQETTGTRRSEPLSELAELISGARQMFEVIVVTCLVYICLQLRSDAERR